MDVRNSTNLGPIQDIEGSLSEINTRAQLAKTKAIKLRKSHHSLNTSLNTLIEYVESNKRNNTTISNGLTQSSNELAKEIEREKQSMNKMKGKMLANQKKMIETKDRLLETLREVLLILDQDDKDNLAKAAIAKVQNIVKTRQSAGKTRKGGRRR